MWVNDTCNFQLYSSPIEKNKRQGQPNFNNTFDSTQYTKILLFQHVISLKMLEILCSFCVCEISVTWCVIRIKEPIRVGNNPTSHDLQLHVAAGSMMVRGWRTALRVYFLRPQWRVQSGRISPSEHEWSDEPPCLHGSARATGDVLIAASESG